ncbi:DUF4197 domain-containing protein [Arsenicibacter rosenii]|uniref:DUF4197 domain-containing protein n=1 Tax=Arsenicibacter rosenii TaxID=1750698 RepID=A0A1S2VF28_9BACT|nr:DUF4197 domain-containing protein [Arsenicibacter rosenii]OIN57333.1 hypothetical protein BLX24_20360 [Arsenicibacter rosenii]
MKKIIWFVAFGSLIGIHEVSAQDSTKKESGLNKFGKFLEKASQAVSSGSGSLTTNEIGQGLKEALKIGVSKGSDQASAVDGYFKNQLIKLAFPPEAQKVEARLRQIGLGPQVDQFILSMNRAAEDAAKEAKPVFLNAVTQMTIPDAVQILKGQDDAATQYLRKTSGKELVTRFTPIIDGALKKNNATKYYADLVNAYNKLPLVKKENPNLTEYATNKAVDGLFLLVAQEEKQIRENPQARITELLKKVFGAQ